VPCDATNAETSLIAQNFVWGTLELLLDVAAALYVTVAVARAFGPTKLGYFNYIYWLTTISGGIGSLGLPLAAFKYMGEYIGAGRPEMARSVYMFVLRLQALLSIVISLPGLILVWFFVLPEYRWVSIFLVIGIIPQVLTNIPSMANNARQDFRSNAHGGFVGITLSALTVFLSLHWGWGLLGVSLGILISRVAEMFVKMRPLFPWLRRTVAVPLSKDLYKRMVRFSAHGTGLMLLSILIWDRSDVILLRLLQPDIRQIAFFSVSFSLVERLMILPQSFGRALSASQMAESGRDMTRLLRMTATAARYALLGSLPLLLGSACLSGPAIRIIYGPLYVPAIPVFGLAAVFAISKATLSPGNSLLYAREDVSFLLKWSCFCAAAEIAIDIVLIPHYAAIGAAIGNGVAQALAAAGIWTRAVEHFHVDLSFSRLVRVALATAAMVLAVLAGTHNLHSDVAKMIVGPFLGAASFVVALRFASVLDFNDRIQLLTLTTRLPGPVHRPIRTILEFVSASPANVDS
jgi:O-antigen/teichoic acid export membrane protein